MTCTTNAFAVGGQAPAGGVTGLANGDSLPITITGTSGTGQPLSVPVTVNGIAGNGEVNFLTPGATPATEFQSGTTYTATLGTETGATTQTCMITGGAQGTVGNGNVTSIAVTCTTNTYALTFVVTGLTNSQTITVTNADNGTCHPATGGCTNLGNGSFPEGTIASDTAYSFSSSQPTNPAETCTVVGGTGTVTNGPVTVDINCGAATSTIGGTTTGLFGALQLNDSDPVVGNANFTVTLDATAAYTGQATAYTGWTVDDGAGYDISVVNQNCANGNPAMASVCWTGANTANQTCLLAGATGNNVEANVTTVDATCTTNTFTVGGTITGLAAGNTIVAGLNGATNTVMLTGTGANQTFTFPTALKSGSGPYGTTPGLLGAYNVTFTNGSEANNISTVSIGPAGPAPNGVFQVVGTVPQLCTLSVPAVNYIENENASTANNNGLTITCVNLYTVGGNVASASLTSGADTVTYTDSVPPGGTSTTASTNNGTTWFIPYAAGYAQQGSPANWVVGTTHYNVSIPNVGGPAARSPRAQASSAPTGFRRCAQLA